MSEQQCISKHVKFSEISAILEKLKAAGPTSSSKKDDILRRYFDSFEQFRREYRQKYGDNAKTSIFPILRLLLPAADRERDSYGIRVKTLRDLYIKILGISESSIEARKLSGFDESGTGSNGNSGDFADRIFTLMRGRCPKECDMTVWDVNERLDAMGQHYQNGRRAKTQDELIRMVQGMTQLDQKWLIRIILKNLRMGMSQTKLLGLYHPKAGALFDRLSHLSKVCDAVESGEGLEEIGEPGSGMAVRLFNPVKPMLCQRVDLKLVDGMLKKDEFWLETKMDGERFQIHKEGQVFKYFSRNSYEYSHVFGENPNHPGSTLTPYLSNLLTASVQSMILDGEMMVFDKRELIYRDKSENTDVKAIKADNPELRPCFCAYDVLFLNGKSLIMVPYAERIRLLKTLIKEKVGFVTICHRVKVKNGEHLVELLNHAIDAHQEGVVIKKENSAYSPNERNAGWYKIKPDYIDNMVSDFDLLIIGGFYNSKRQYINTFLVGVMDDRDKENPIFFAATKVGIGLSIDQWKQLNSSLRPHWQDVTARKQGRTTVTEEPPELRWGQTPPDVWVHPTHSIVLQLKGSELVQSTSFATAYTIRFPRITAIRSDKGFCDVTSKDEYDQLCSANTKVAKLAKRHVTVDDLTPGNVDSSNGRKRKKSSPLQRNRSTRLNLNLNHVDETAEELIDNVGSGLDFCVLSTSRGQPPIAELEKMIRRHGGRVVKNPGPKTYLTIAGDRTFLVDRIIDSQVYNVATVDWLQRALGGSEKKDQLLPLRPNDMLAATESLREEMSDHFDRFGDSLTAKISNAEEMRALLKQVTLDDGPLSTQELQEGRREILGKRSGFRIFQGLVGQLYRENLKTDIDLYRAKFRMLKLIREGGQWLAESGSKGTTHVFVTKNESLDEEHLQRWVDGFAKQNRKVDVLNIDWIDCSLREKRTCDEQLYRVL
ncbi:DNA ligase 4-like [Aedes albopictus]|uniref:DNA ligase 4 n=1 Tax=Aedes albopictus TaxID=7160 RepID=A0ABM1Z7S3_AEDAL|nr:LOW QUALITY PROTEIN: DNA ligase 4-like [Aedes albopictus]